MVGAVWPADADSLVAAQRELAPLRPEPWTPYAGSLRVGGCWACFPRGLTGPGHAGDPVWAAAATLHDGRVVEERSVRAQTLAAYTPGLLALRMGPALAEAVAALAGRPDVLLLDATGRDHPRAAGLALHLGAMLELPTVGVTHRPLHGRGEWPEDRRGATSPIHLGGEVVAAWLRTRPGTRPLVVHPGWRTTVEAAVDVVLRVSGQRRTPEPLRRARHLARLARDRA